MSTVTEPAAPATQYSDKNAPGYVPAPAGMRYVRANGKVVIGEDGKPVVTKSKAKGAKRNKPSKLVYAVPSTKMPTAETKGFDVESHAKLKVSDFADPLDYHKWNMWYFGQKLASATKDHDSLLKLGATAEERIAAQEDLKIATAFRNLMARRQGGAKSRLGDLLGELYAESQTQ